MQAQGNPTWGPPTNPHVMLDVAWGAPDLPAAISARHLPAGSLWVRGRLPRAGEPLLAIVGSRAATGAGCAFARELAAGLAARGFSIVSGGAFGIDAAAHRGALAAGAATFAVLGCGADVVYPDRHGELFDAIAQGGGLLSAYPPGTPPRAGHFPRRNELIVALAGAVIVVEAAPRSGALVTARLCERAGKPLLAWPGSRGTDAWLAEGRAIPIADAAGVVAALRGETPARVASSGRVTDGAHAALLAALAAGARTPALLAARLGVTLGEAMSRLAMAELDGVVRRGAGAYEVARGE